MSTLGHNFNGIATQNAEKALYRPIFEAGGREASHFLGATGSFD